MKRCPKCNATAFLSDNYCSKDGTLLEHEPKCDCGYELSNWEKYCPKCGKANTINSK